jgi:DNA-binding phage protein
MSCEIRAYLENGESVFDVWFNDLDAVAAARVDRHVRRMETEEGLSMLRDLIHATITFKTLATETGLNEKSLHRMLGPNGNPTARNMAAILQAVRTVLGFVPQVRIAGASR